MRRTLLQLAVATLFAYAAIRTGMVLTDHDVPTLYVVLPISFAVSTGLSAVNFFGPKPRTYTCPAPGCGISIQINRVDDATEQSMRDLATDHAAHAATRP